MVVSNQHKFLSHHEYPSSAHNCNYIYHSIPCVLFPLTFACTGAIKLQGSLHQFGNIMAASAVACPARLLDADSIYFVCDGKRLPRMFDISGLTEMLRDGVRPCAESLRQLRTTYQKRFAQVAPAQVLRSHRFEVEIVGEGVLVEREAAYDTLFKDDFYRCVMQPPQPPRCIQWDDDEEPFWRISSEAKELVRIHRIFSSFVTVQNLTI
jgi:hypothetical protein